MGIFTLLITVLAFAAGSIRNELVLLLVGTVFLLVLSGCFFAVWVLSFCLRTKVRMASARILSKGIPCETEGAVTFSLGPAYIPRKGGRAQFFRLPGILVRYEMRLVTKDGREIRHIFDPDALEEGVSPFPATLRGAYYGPYDALVVADIPGFFFRAIPLPQDTGPRLLVSPRIPETPISLHIRSGGTLRRREPHFLRTDNFIDHRPYIPGDDPRRLNWKLYGHAGDLFVREGEPEPPPHSHLLILVDTQGDEALYIPSMVFQGVDRLCENALALAIRGIDRGMEVAVGYTGGEIYRGTQGELALALAYPTVAPLSGPEDLPVSEDQGILILALPRLSGIESALDRFLKQRNPYQAVDLVFLYEGPAYDEAAAACVRLYGQKKGVHARRVPLNP
jgi:uncharacterized protein (DUF58 family)